MSSFVVQDKYYPSTYGITYDKITLINYIVINPINLHCNKYLKLHFKVDQWLLKSTLLSNLTINNVQQSALEVVLLFLL